MYSILPNKALKPNGPISETLIDMGFDSFHQVCDWIWRLPYGRTRDSQNYLSVIKEQKGTCSTKHALLKALVDELGIKVELTIGIYAMTQANTPGVGEVLEQYQQAFILEAHCYLSYQGNRVDLTRFMTVPSEPITAFFIEKNITADEITAGKQPFHYAFIQNLFGLEQAKAVWKIREQCIKALSEQ
ncbi:hypothetical protein [Shewanella surugensis]|uniref:Transglutaminase-like domain-containing protein n=1 Tax=Shewanella surugensis TaxID=212020 RepID=A0ABT0LDU5_9GAMM|nr:hypothetical protein [Shewanella surugensis]MCL1125316.1 hypothetical protein [Shewanella surugensis]